MKVSTDPSKPGMHYGIKFEDYLKIDAVSKSILWKFHQTSPAGLQHWLKNPGDPTEAMTLGSMVDIRVSDGLKAFQSQFQRTPPDLRRDKRSKKYQDFLTACGSKTPVKAIDYDKVETMYQKIMDYPLARKRIEGATKQLSLVWDHDGHIPMKGRPDFVAFINEQPELVDLKVSQSIKPEYFIKTADRFGYHWQAAIYLDGFSQLQGFGCHNFSFVVIEDHPPFGVEVFKLAYPAIELGREEYRETLKNYYDCVLQEKWPASSGQIQVLDFPIWRYPKMEVENV